MDIDVLAASAKRDSQPPGECNEVARCLWLAKAARWDEAHDLCQDIPGVAGAWIHAWLHRQEGDYGNARYWYAKAGKPAAPEGSSLESEWRAIAEELLAKP